MSAARTKVFGMELAVDPKILILALILVAIVVYYFTSSSEPSGGSGGNSQAASVAPAASPAPVLPRRAAVRRPHIDRDVLKFVAVDGSRGDVDPTLRLRLLERVKNVPPAAGLRNLFDTGNPVVAQNVPPVPVHPPILPPKPMGGLPGLGMPTQPPVPTFTIPLKYYGYARSKNRPLDGNRGLFLDGDNILIGAEGDTLEKRYLIVALTPTSARLEDTQVKQGQELPVMPEALAQ